MPFEAVDYIRDTLSLAIHQPVWDLIVHFLRYGVSDNEQPLLLVDIQILLKVRRHVEGVLGVPEVFIREVHDSSHKFPPAQSWIVRVIHWHSLVNEISLEEKPLIHVLAILTEVDVLHLAFPEWIDERSYLFDFSLADNFNEAELTILFWLFFSKWHLVLNACFDIISFEELIIVNIFSDGVFAHQQYL